MNLKELGELLGQQREQQGLTVSDVYQHTKISPSCIRSIEQGNLEDLPHPVYVKGFIRSYAQLLGLDAEQLVQVFDKNVLLSNEEEEKEVEPVMTLHKKRTLYRRTLSIVASVLVVFVVSYILYDLFWDTGHDEQFQEVSEIAREDLQVVQQEHLKDTDEFVALSVPESEEAVNDKNAQIEELEDLPATPAPEEPDAALQLPEEAVKLAKENDKPEQLEAVEEEKMPDEAAEPEIKEEVNHLKISAIEDCWLRVEVDGQTEEELLDAGSSISFEFQEALHLRLGNAGGVSLEYNGDDYPLDALSGEIKELSFP